MHFRLDFNMEANTIYEPQSECSLGMRVQTIKLETGQKQGSIEQQSQMQQETVTLIFAWFCVYGGE